MRVLVAEDDTVSRLLIETALRKWGYEVVSVCDGHGAWAALEAPDAPRLAVLDWMMPGIDGVEICRRVRARGGDDPPYLILLTALSQKESIVAGLGAGANDYVTKPFDREELHARVRVGERVLGLQAALVQQLRELQKALSHVKTLQGILPICMHCHRIRTDQESWQRVELYIQEHSDAQFSHSLCPECLEKFYLISKESVSMETDGRDSPRDSGGPGRC